MSKVRTDDLLMSDAGNAEILVRLAGKDLKWCGAMSKDGWVFWDGRRWAPDETHEIMRRAKKVANIWRLTAPEYCSDLVTDDSEKARNKRNKDVMKHVIRCESTSGLKAMIEQAACDPGIAVRRDVFDADRWAFNAQNGTVNLHAFTIHGHRREEHITKLGGANLREQACPNWLAFLDATFKGNADLIAYIQRAMGYSLTGITKEQCFFLLYGMGRNGKGTLVETLRKIAGEYAVNIQVETLSMRREGGTSPDLATMAGARVVTASEGKEGLLLDEGLIKQITGGDPLTCNPKYRDPFSFFPEFKLWFSANYKPKITGTDLGIWSRVHMIPFTESFAGREDKELRAKLDAEIDGIFAWCLEGAKAWLEGGLRPPATVVNATAEYKKEMDVVGQWIEECCNPKPGVPDAATLVASLYKSYSEWCKENGTYPKAAKWFGQQLEAKGYPLAGSHSDGRKRKGILLLSPIADPSQTQKAREWRNTDH